MLWDGFFEDEGGHPLPEEVQRAARAVLERLPGCPLPNCYACDANRQAVADLLTVARRTRNARVQP